MPPRRGSPLLHIACLAATAVASASAESDGVSMGAPGAMIVDAATSTAAGGAATFAGMAILGVTEAGADADGGDVLLIGLGKAPPPPVPIILTRRVSVGGGIVGRRRAVATVVTRPRGVTGGIEQ